jgi:rhomboid protease GluP
MDATTLKSTELAEQAQPTVAQGSEAITFSLIAVNVLVFIVMLANGAGFWEPTAQQVLKWGADYGPLTLNGQWWRIFASVFVHLGLMHIVLNMFVLLSIGPFMERLSGGTAYLLLYIVSGIGGAAASLIWHPFLVSCGASGAIFGLYGGLLAYLLRYRSTIPNESLTSLLKGATIFIGYNLIYGLAKPEVDLAAHLGGLAAGFVAGLFLIPSLGERSAGGNFGRYAVGALIGTAMLAATLVALPKPDDLEAELARMAAMEEKTLALFNESLNNWKADKLSTAQFSEVLEKRVLAPWRVEEKSLEKMKRLSSKQQQIAASLSAYMQAREEGWALLLHGIKTNDLNEIKRSKAKSEEADSLAKAIGGEN